MIRHADLPEALANRTVRSGSAAVLDEPAANDEAVRALQDSVDDSSSVVKRRIVIVGGGAGGLELACSLGRKLGPDRVTLIDKRLEHVWKPTLHELAAGTLDAAREAISYLMLARDNDFEFVLGAMSSVDTDARRVGIDAVLEDTGEPLLSARSIAYDDLVIAIGSTANFFGTDGAREHALALDSPRNAAQFRSRLLRALAHADVRKRDDASAAVHIVIVGGGATGVELAAELREAARLYSGYGFKHLNPVRDVSLTVLEGADQLLSPLPAKLAAKAAALLEERNIEVVTGCLVKRVGPDSVEDADGNLYTADLCVWTAGIKAPPFLGELGLPTGKGGAIEVDEYLMVRDHPDIHAIGDCAACPLEDGSLAPPRAQTAHQQASYLHDVFLRRERSSVKSEPFRYKDHGSLVSIGSHATLGSLLGPGSSSLSVNGWIARAMYLGLRLSHSRALLGFFRASALALGQRLAGRARPRVKLH